MALLDPEKLPAAWEPLVKRLAATADRECGRKGYAVITVQVLVNMDALPMFYTEPTVTKLEPRQGATVFMDNLLRYIANERVATE